MIEEKKKYMKDHIGTDSHNVKTKSGKLKETYSNRGIYGGTHCDTLYPTHICTNNKRNN